MSRGRGFTLIEMLVVLVIIGVVSAGVLLSIGPSDSDEQIERERERLIGLIDYARERASLQVQEHGLRLTPTSYSFSVFDNRSGAWVAESADEILEQRRLPEGLSVQLDLEGRRVVLKEPKPDAGADGAGAGAGDDEATVADAAPQIMLFANGDTSDFALTVRREAADRAFTIRNQTDGSLDYGRVGGELP